jgi:mono/diheme cytochrome c family protein
MANFEGEQLYRQPMEGGNTFACATCHALAEPAADGIRRVGHALGRAPQRGTYKSGQLTDMRQAVNSCLIEWMGTEPWEAGDPRWTALSGWLDAQPGGTEAFSLQIVQPPIDTSGGDAASGGALFNMSCIMCHGQDGMGAERAPRVMATGLSADYVATRVRTSGSPDSAVYQGLTGGRMPFWGGDRLTDGELRDLIAFVTEEEKTSGGDKMATIGAPGECASTHPTVGHVAELRTIFHGVQGTATIVNDCTIRIDDFFFDGNGIDVRIYAGLGGDYDGGFAITDDLFNFPTGYSGATVYAVLPEGRSLDNLDGISVWCVDAKVDFGSGTFAAP